MNTLSLTAMRDALAAGEVRPSEAVAASLQQIAATEPRLNACITIMGEQATAQAAQLEQDYAHSKSKPLYGVPLTVKDLFCTQGTRTTCASPMLETFVPPYNAFVVDRLLDAGAVLVAKTNLDEFAMGSTCETSATGATTNPWDTSRIAGGSSGGSAASVAAFQAFGSLGTDSGGSIRQPAALCGCVGLKPTYGRVSRYGVVAYASSFDQAGPMARSVADCALLFSVIAGYDERDATCANLPVPDLTSVSTTTSLAGKTLGVPKEMWQASGIAPEVASACALALEAAKDLGAKVVDVSLPHLPYAVATYYILTAAEASTNLARFDGVRFGLRAGKADDLVAMYTDSRSQGFGEEVKRRILLGTYALSAGYYDAYFTKAARVRRLIQHDFHTALQGCDALLAPACPVTAWELGAHKNDPLTVYKMDILTLGMNLAGLPALSLPVGLGADSKLPVGMQIMGKAFDEAGILGIGNALERALPALGRPRALS